MYSFISLRSKPVRVDFKEVIKFSVHHRNRCSSNNYPTPYIVYRSSPATCYKWSNIHWISFLRIYVVHSQHKTPTLYVETRNLCLQRGSAENYWGVGGRGWRGWGQPSPAWYVTGESCSTNDDDDLSSGVLSVLLGEIRLLGLGLDLSEPAIMGGGFSIYVCLSIWRRARWSRELWRHLVTARVYEKGIIMLQTVRCLN